MGFVKVALRYSKKKVNVNLGEHLIALFGQELKLLLVLNPFQLVGYKFLKSFRSLQNRGSKYCFMQN